jgi:hypothetical protein
MVSCHKVAISAIKPFKLSANPRRVSTTGRKLLINAAAIKGVVQTKPPIIFIKA